MAITPGKLQTQSSAHALVIGPDTTPSKYLSRLLIYAVIALAAKGYSEAVVGHCFTNIRAIARLAKKLKFLSEDPAEDVTKPQTKSIERPVITREQIALLLD